MNNIWSKIGGLATSYGVPANGPPKDEAQISARPQQDVYFTKVFIINRLYMSMGIINSSEIMDRRAAMKDTIITIS